jgi:hypothetical protein
MHTGSVVSCHDVLLSAAKLPAGFFYVKTLSLYHTDVNEMYRTK